MEKINEINPHENKVDYNEIERVLSKNPNQADTIAMSIINNKGTTLTNQDITSLLTHTVDHHEIAKAIINAKKETLQPNDIVKLSFFDKENLDDLKSELLKYISPDIVEKNAQDWETKNAQSKQDDSASFHKKQTSDKMEVSKSDQKERQYLDKGSNLTWERGEQPLDENSLRTKIRKILSEIYK